MRRVEQIMGMPISIDIPQCDEIAVFDQAFAIFRKLDEQYSTYKTTSEVVRYNKAFGAGEWSKDLSQTIETCKELERQTDGYFSAFYNDTFDPSGYIKARAIKESVKAISGAGYERFMVNAAGDIFASSNTELWMIGLQNPIDLSSILAEVALQTGAIATSGTYKRGHHIYNPKTRQTINDVLSLSIIGPNIVLADVYATAGCAMGSKQAISFLNQQTEYKALLIDADKNIYTTDNFTI